MRQIFVNVVLIITKSVLGGKNGRSNKKFQIILNAKFLFKMKIIFL